MISVFRIDSAHMLQQKNNNFRSRVAVLKYMEAVGTYSQDDIDKAGATKTS
jgi:hypothetical protein